MKIRFSMCILILLLSACAHTRIAAREIPQEGVKLSSLATQRVSFHVACNVDEIVGHQYLLVALPFGRISIQDPSLHLQNHLVVALAERGIRGVSSSAGQSAITITCRDLSLTAYDYLFFRQIVSSIEWTIELSHPAHVTQTLPMQRTRISAIKAFAFYPQLEYQLHHLLLDASKSIAESPVWALVMGRR